MSDHTELLAALAAGHAEAAERDNASTVMIKLHADLGSTFEQAVAAAIGALGGKHGPITQARDAIFGPSEVVVGTLMCGGRIPGFGHSIYKNEIDPAFGPTFKCLADEHPNLVMRIRYAQNRIEDTTGRRLYPNAAAFTAAVASIIGLPFGTEAQLFISARLPVWGRIYSEIAGTHHQGTTYE